MAERETYQPPQFSGAQDGDNNAGFSENHNPAADAVTANNGNLAANQTDITGNKAQLPIRAYGGGRQEYDTPDRKIHYLCGDCGKSQGFAANDPIRCAKCGGRTMFKPRSKRCVCGVCQDCCKSLETYVVCYLG